MTTKHCISFCTSKLETFEISLSRAEYDRLIFALTDSANSAKTCAMDYRKQGEDKAYLARKLDQQAQEAEALIGDLFNSILPIS